MAFFGVTVETIDKIWPHPNADRLELASLENLAFQFIIGKGSFSEGDNVLYFPIDSVLTQETAKSLGLEGKLAGKQRNRVKTVRLRGEISQGVVGPVSLIENITTVDGEYPSTEEITDFLGVKKYEPEAVVCKDADLLPLPAGLSAYDIEGAERFGHIVDLLMDEPVYVSEKVEGSNFSVTHSVLDEKTYVNQRNYTIKLKEGADTNSHTWWKVAKESGLLVVAQTLSAQSGQTVTIYGELIGPGVQENYYGVNKHKALLFDVKIGESFMDYEGFRDLCTEYSLEPVPTLTAGTKLSDWLGDQTVQKAANGKSKLCDKLREGIVIKPMKERYEQGFGRLFIKQRDPVYLGETDN